MAAVMDIQ